MATALQIAQEAAAAAGLESPSTLNAGDGLQVRALLNRAGRDLAEKRGTWGQSWPDLTKSLEVTLIAGQDHYALPAGFGGLILDTTWDVNETWPAAGPVSPAEWAVLKHSVAGYASPSLFYRVAVNPATGHLGLQMHPVPEAASVVALDYLSRWWVRPSATTAPSLDVIESDVHTPVFPDELMILALEWRLRAAEGLAFAVQLGEFEMRRDRIFSHLTGDSARLIDLHAPGIGGLGNVSVSGGASDPIPSEPIPEIPVEPAIEPLLFYVGLSDDETPDPGDVTHAVNSEVSLSPFTSKHIVIFWPSAEGAPETILFSDDPSNDNALGAFTEATGTYRLNGVNYRAWVSNQLLTHVDSVIMTVS